jgi:serine-type D-Ala-D-Ala carboxypeptidase/endopeptidase (penicillin-binding protein 4)
MSFRNRRHVLIASLFATFATARVATVPAGQAHAAVLNLQHDIDAILARPALERTFWGVLVRSLEANDTLYALNAGKLMMPASNLKIVTLAVAAERLGWAYTFETRLVGTGPITDGSLEGDLVVVGFGDPSVGLEGTGSDPFDVWAERLKASGVLAIHGRIIGDDNTFEEETLGPGWAWDYLGDGYAAGSGALQLNENVVFVTIGPGQAVGTPAVVSISTDSSGLEIRNDLKTASAGTLTAITTRRLPGSVRLELRGTVALGSARSVHRVSVDNPTQFFVTALRAKLIAHGIEVEGPAIDIDDLPNPPSRQAGTLLAIYRSPPLSTLAVRMMKASQNLYAETLLKTMGAEIGMPSVSGGREAVRSTLESWSIMPAGLIMVDGSGLSRYNLVTPESLVALLTRIDRTEQLRGPFEDALPVAGRDGTLEGRMKNTAAENNARAKTGVIANARSLSGYVRTTSGEPLVFSILANNFETTTDVIDRATDAIVVRLATFKRQN